MKQTDARLAAILLILPSLFVSPGWAYAADQPTTIWMIAPEIGLSLGDTQDLSGESWLGFSAFNPNTYAASGNLSIKIGMLDDEGGYEYLPEWTLCEDMELVVSSLSYENASFSIADLSLGEGSYKAYVRFEYNDTYTTTYKTFEIETSQAGDGDNSTDDGQDDGGQGGEESLEITSMYERMRFGDIRTVGATYNPGPNRYGKVRVVAYVSGPKKASNDLEGNTIYQRFCHTDTGMEIRHPQEGSDHHLAIPLILKRNCDDDLAEGNYTVTLRACIYMDDGWEYHKDGSLKKKSAIRIKSNDRCYQEKDIGGNKLTGPCQTDGPDTRENYRPYTIHADTTAYEGVPFSTRIELDHMTNASISAYSYAYSEGKLISLGYDGSGWTGSWKANMASLEDCRACNGTITLWNRIDKDPGNASYIKTIIGIGDDTYEETRDISIERPLDEGIMSLDCQRDESSVIVSASNMMDDRLNSRLYIIKEGRTVTIRDVVLEGMKAETFVINDEDRELSMLLIDSKNRLCKCYVTAYHGNYDELSKQDIPYEEMITGNAVASGGYGLGGAIKHITELLLGGLKR